jgi:hypothetical protein
MRDLTVGDRTQRALLPQLARTERLLARAASHVSGRSCDAEVIALSDLGLANGPRRMLGGFFTGALYRWDAPAPMVPVDATVNVCSVSLHRVARVPARGEFDALIQRARALCADETPYAWNLDVGNHFATVGSVHGSEVLEDGEYLLLHASAAEYKRTPQGLYPTPRAWYADEVRVVDDGRRALRYLAGASAERFVELAHALVAYNADRHRVLAELIAAPLGLEPGTCRPHYGMPDGGSVAIGCHWLPPGTGWYVLLTEPGEDVLLVAPDDDGPNRAELGGRLHTLTPHGLGLRAREGAVHVGREHLRIGSEPVDPDASLLADDRTTLRSLREDPRLLSRILASAPGRIVGRFVPRHSHHRGAETMSQRLTPAL